MYPTRRGNVYIYSIRRREPSCFFLMEPPFVASLMTECGPLRIYSVQALCEVIETLPKSFSLPLDDGLGAAHNNVASNVSPTFDSCHSQGVIEGWNTEQWSKWGRKKSALASNICKLNGSLKARIADLESRVSAASVPNRPGSTCEGVDPLVQEDPWANGAGHFSFCTTKGSGGSDAWAAWQPQRLQCGRTDMEEESHTSVGTLEKNDEPVLAHSPRGLVLDYIKHKSLACNGDPEDFASGDDHFVARVESTKAMSDTLLKDIVERAFERQEARTAHLHTTEELIENVLRASETRMEAFSNEVGREYLGTG